MNSTILAIISRERCCTVPQTSRKGFRNGGYDSRVWIQCRKSMDKNLEERNRIRKYHFTQLFTIRERVILRRNSSKLELSFAYHEKLATINNSPRISNWIASVVESRTSDNSDRDNRTPFLVIFITRENLTFRFEDFRNRLYYLWCGKNLDKRTKNSSSNFWCEC